MKASLKHSLLAFALGSAVALGATRVMAGEGSPELTYAEIKAARPPRVPIVAVGSQITWNVPYKSGGTHQQSLDIYAPEGAQDAAVVIYVHRGEWAKGDKSEVCYKPKVMNENGVVFVSVNYRLSDVAPHPAQVNDVAAAVRWVHDHISEYGGAPDRIVLMGHSAGCHIVSMVGLDPRPLATVGLTPGDLSGVVSWSGGAFDLPAKVAESGMYKPYIEQNFGTNLKDLEDASPVNHAHKADPDLKFLYVSGSKSKALSRELSERMVAEIQAAGGQAASLTLEGKTHFTVDYECGKSNDPINSAGLLLEFIESATERKLN